jgi:hypothetical protein
MLDGVLSDDYGNEFHCKNLKEENENLSGEGTYIWKEKGHKFIG